MTSRDVIIHLHPLNNKETTFDDSLKRNFGNHFIDSEDQLLQNNKDSLEKFLIKNSTIKALSIHSIPFVYEGNEGIHLHPVYFIEDYSEGDYPANLETISIVGIRDRYDESAIVFEAYLREFFPSIDLSYPCNTITDSQVETISEKNCLTTGLYKKINKLLDQRISQVINFESRLKDFKSRCMLLYIKQLINEKHYTLADELAAVMIEQRSENIHIYLAHADVLLKQKKFSDAIKVYDHTIENFSTNPWPYFLKTSVMYLSGQKSEARKLFDAYSDKFSDQQNIISSFQHKLVSLKGFDKRSYLQANESIGILLKEGKFSSLEYYLELEGLEKIRIGKQKFHIDFEPFDESLFLESAPAVKMRVDKGEIASGFDFFLDRGYVEILEGKRAWSGIGEKRLNDLRKYFDIASYLEANPHIENLIKEKKFYGIWDYLRQKGMEKISEGLEPFHAGFESYDEAVYLDQNSEVKEAIEQGEIISGFDHFCSIGYEKLFYKVIQESELFDTSYYLSEYIDVKQSGEDPLEHYMMNGAREGKNPSKIFDTKFYRTHYQDVREGGLNPLYHYIMIGKREGRKTREKTYPSEYNDYRKLREIKSDISVAVIVHIYYIDLWQEIVEKLKKIIYPYRLYITTTDALYDEVSKLEMPETQVKIFKYNNLGMDLYPFLQVLREVAKEGIELFCKLHTKKGNEKSGRLWRETLLEQNIGNNTIFSGIVGAFSADEALRLAGSAFFYKNIDYLIGDNRPEVEEAVSVMHLDKASPRENGFFAGSMFWGRVDDYTALSTYATKNKFESAENISNSDSHFSHAIERMLGCIHTGMKKVGLVYRGNEQGEYFLEKMTTNKGMFNNINDTLMLLSDFRFDYRLLSNFRFFNREGYSRYFPHLNGQGIDFLYHYLTIGRFFYRADIPNKLLEVFGYDKEVHQKILPLIYLALTGSLQDDDFKNDRDLTYEVIRLKMNIAEIHLIDWIGENQKLKHRGLVSIIIPVYGQAEMTDACLNSILETDAGVAYEIIIVNNGQDEEDIKALDRWKNFPSIKIIHNDENLNFALGCNLGFSRSIGEQIVFLNNDTTVTNNWLFELLLPLKNQNISMTQPRLLYPDGKLQGMGIVFSDKSKLAYPLYHNLDVPNDILNTNRYFNAVTGACMAVRAADFALVKGFDTHYVNGQEDVDFCLKLNRLKNTKAMYASSAVVYHYEGKSKGRGSYISNNREYFIEKWGQSIVPDDAEHYRADEVEVLEWKLDSKIYKERGIENYLPKTKFFTEKCDSHSSLPVMDSFYIKGRLLKEGYKKTILLSAHLLDKQIYGGERSFLDIVQAIDKTKYNLIITLPNKSNKAYIRLLKEHAVSIYIIKYHMWNRQGTSEKTIRLLENIMQSESIDLLYSNTIMNREVLMAAKNKNILRVIHVRELIIQDENLMKKISQDSESILSELLSMSDYLIANSKITMDMFSIDNLSLVYNKIETNLFKNIKNTGDRKKIKFALISSNGPKKGVYDFVEIAKLCKYIKNAHFVLVGPVNSYVKEIEQTIEKDELTNITVAGYFQTPAEAIKECNVLLSLSLVPESFGRTIGEASAAGRPVIAYRYGAIPELVEEGKNGFLVNYKDINAVVHYIELFCRHQEIIDEMGDEGRIIIEKISSPTIYIEKLNEALDRFFEIKKKQDILPITIIVPIYNAYDEVINCIDSLINTTAGLSIHILLIDDNSTDIRLKSMLYKYNNIANFRVVFNDENIGYTRTVNKGIMLAGSDDVILLNSDTIVTSDWIEGLYDTAYSETTIGTVTAMSDNAGAFSFPKQSIANPKPLQMTHNNYANLLLRESSKTSPVEVPTGSGFCLYIKRTLMDDIGLFDQEAFPRGYGEENDFCMRAMRRGWKNVIASNAFVFHVRTASFKEEKERLTKISSKTLLQMHPNYNEEVQKAWSSGEMQNLREATQTGVESLMESIQR